MNWIFWIINGLIGALICDLVDRLCWYKKENENLMELCEILEQQSCDALRELKKIKYGTSD